MASRALLPLILNHCGEHSREVRVVVISDDRSGAECLGGLLRSIDPAAFEFGYAGYSEWNSDPSLRRRYDAAIVEYPLPEGITLAECLRAESIRECPPIIVVDRTGTAAPGLQIVQEGAQDYLLKSTLTGEILVRAICYAIERHRLRRELDNQANRLRTVINFNADGMLVVNREGRILFANPQAEQLLGRSREQLREWDFGFPVVEGDFVEITVREPGGALRTTEMRVVEIEWDGAPAFLATLRDVSRRKAVEDALRRYQQRAQALAAELSQAEQRERRYLAQILHDGLQQILVAAKMNLDVCRAQARDSELVETVESVIDLIDQSLSTSRSLVAELSPAILYDRGLVPALESLARSMKDRFGIEVTIEAPPGFDVDDEDLKAFLFQAVRELLFNIVKHAEAAPTRVALAPDDGRLRIVVRDNGPGFEVEALEARDADQNGFGLFSIQQRLDYLDGSMEIDSGPGQGCCVTILVPLAQRDAAAM